ncbi:hypothetical protein ABW21_db0205497 [Orbilia brochopaga]|nr:hypothetical protein ABW21_db0205497 [Drechslerella brochopaga]
MTPDDQNPDAGASQTHRNGHLPATRSSSRLSKPPLQVDTEAAQNLSPSATVTDDVVQLLNPSKKRKLNGQPSPPWKSAAAQTPSSFIDDSGRKRSMRTMAPPPTPVTPAKAGRRMRSASTTAVSATDDKSSKTKQFRPGTRTSPRSKQQAAIPTATAKSPSSKRQLRANGKHATPSTRSPASAKSIQSRRSAHASQTPTKSSSQRKMGSRKASSAASSAPRRRSGRLSISTAPEHTDDEDEDEDAEMQDASDGMTEQDYDSSKRISWRLKFSRKVKPPVLCNPINIALPRKHTSLRAFFETEDNDPEYLKQMQDAADIEAAKRIKLEEAYDAGLLRPESLQPPNIQLVPGPERLRPQWGHRDHFVNHAVRFSKLLKRERMQHIKDAKAIAKDAAEAARKRRPKSREEIEAEQREVSVKRYKEVVATFKGKLKLAEKVCISIMTD